MGFWLDFCLLRLINQMICLINWLIFRPKNVTFQTPIRQSASFMSASQNQNTNSDWPRQTSPSVRMPPHLLQWLQQTLRFTYTETISPSQMSACKWIEPVFPLPIKNNGQAYPRSSLTINIEKKKSIHSLQM